MTWDSDEVRRAREEGWFAQNERKLIEAARQRRADAERARQSAESDALRAAHWLKCPKCGHDMTTERIEDIAVERCSGCEGIFFDRGELEQLLLHHEPRRRGVFRRLLGLRE